jgi:phage baseplate assembly protein V
MTASENGTVNRVARFINAVIGWSRVKIVNDSGTVQKVQLQTNALETIDNIPRVAEFGLASVPPADSDVVMVNHGGGRNNATIIGTNHQPSRPTNLKPGETMVYSEDGKSVYFTASGGIVIEAKGQTVTINDASNVTVNCSGVFKVVAPGGIEFDAPLVKSSGDIQDNFSTNSRTMAGMRTVYNGHNHVVRGVQPGSSNITSDTPTQTE